MDMDLFKDSVFIHFQTSQPEPLPDGIGALLIHRVRGGDTLWGISRRFGTTVGRLVAPNHISGLSVICKGQILGTPDILKA